MPSIKATATATPRGWLGRFIPVKLTPALRAGVLAYAKVAHEESQALVHVKTGRLKASGTESPFPEDAPGGIRIIETDKTVRAEITYTAPYASYLEWRFPYLRPGMDAARDAGFALFKGQVVSSMKE